MVTARLTRYLPLGSLDADDLRQEIAVAELQSLDVPGHLWDVLRHHHRRRASDAPVEAVTPADTSVESLDLIDALPIPASVRAEVREAYATGTYSRRARYWLRIAGEIMSKEGRS